VATLTLEDGFPAPLQSYPSQVVHRGAGEILRAPVWIEVLHAEKNPSISIGGATVGNGKSECMPEV
jgi:hypothetical protein